MSVAAAASPLAAEEFAILMGVAAPYESRPLVAVAVSGGADSMALCLLAADWARRRGGRAVGLTVDHRLRPEAADEAARVGAWLAARGIEHRTLRWRGDRPATGIQAAARTARYTLLSRWCRDNGALHLLLGHHRDDQAETFLLRLGRGSGIDGLAAMAAVRESDGVRIIRPLLPVPAARLRATLVACGQPWIEDPSNADTAYARTRVRNALPDLAGLGLSPERLAATAAAVGRARSVLDRACADLLVRCVRLFPAGYALVDRAQLLAAPQETGMRALARLLMTVGGGTHPPRLARLARLYDLLGQADPPGRTLAGCRLLPRRDGVLVCREPAAADSVVSLMPGQKVRWDNRFIVTLDEDVADLRPPVTVARLGSTGWRTLGGDLNRGFPAAVAPSLPALYDLDGLLAVPHLDCRRGAPDGASRRSYSARFQPARVLAGSGFPAPASWTE